MIEQIVLSITGVITGLTMYSMGYGTRNWQFWVIVACLVLAAGID